MVLRAQAARASGRDRARDRGAERPAVTARLLLGVLAAIRIRNRYAALHVARLGPGQSVAVPDAPFVHVYLARGRMDLEAEGALDAGDAARLTAAGARRLTAAEPSEVLIWEMHATLQAT
jgi:quercetin 2,3-dioxygenase